MLSLKIILTRIFHTTSLRGAAKLDGNKECDGLQRRRVYTYRPRRNSSVTQSPSGLRKPQQMEYEIFGLRPSNWVCHTVLKIIFRLSMHANFLIDSLAPTRLTLRVACGNLTQSVTQASVPSTIFRITRIFLDSRSSPDQAPASPAHEGLLVLAM